MLVPFFQPVIFKEGCSDPVALGVMDTKQITARPMKVLGLKNRPLKQVWQSV
jgi:hypothetical protein